jgi:hypothetical protein
MTFHEVEKLLAENRTFQKSSRFEQVQSILYFLNALAGAKAKK